MTNTVYNNELARLKKIATEGKISEKVSDSFGGFNYSSLEELAENVIKWRKSDSVNDKFLLVKYGSDQDLDTLVHDSDWKVRRAVAWRERDKDLDILVHDENPNVRGAVAFKLRDKDLDILVHDKDTEVRRIVALVGRNKDLDILVHDEAHEVREAAYVSLGLE